MGLKIYRDVKYPVSHVPTSILTPSLHPWHSAITLFHIYIYNLVSRSHCKGGRGMGNLTDEDTEVSMEYHTGHKAPTLQKAVLTLHWGRQVGPRLGGWCFLGHPAGVSAAQWTVCAPPSTPKPQDRGTGVNSSSLHPSLLCWVIPFVFYFFLIPFLRDF